MATPLHKSPRALARRLVGAAILVNLLVVAFLAEELRTERERNLSQAAASVQTVARLLERTFDGVFDRVDLALLATSDEVAALAGAQDPARLAQVFARNLERVPELTTLRTADAAGDIDRGLPALSGPTSVADRDYFLAARGGQQGLIISKPIVSRKLDVPVVTCARRLSNPDGSFAGVVFGALTVARLAQVLSEVDVGPRGVLVLRDRDLGAVVRRGPSGLDLTLTEQQSSPQLRRLVSEGRTSGVYQATPVVDGITRVYAFRKVEGRPLYAIVGFAFDDVLASFQREAAEAAAMLGLFALVSGLAVWSGLRSLRRAGEESATREQTLTSLRESEGRLAAAFDAFPDAVAITALDKGRYLLINQGFTKVTGWSAAQVIGKSSIELGVWVDPADRKAVVRTLEERGTIDHYEALFRRPDGTTFNGQMSGRVVTIDGARFLLTITRDLTQQRQLEAQLQQAQRLESVGRLAGGVAHDFNNMLLVILGEAAVLEGALPPDYPERQSVEAILQAAQRSRELTRQLLALSRKQVISPRVVDLNALVAATRQPLSRLIGADVDLSFEPAPALWPVRLDPSQLDQVLMNLVVNARDAMPEGGALSLRTANVPADASAGPARCGLPAGDYVALSVQDEGVGMSPETLTHAFEPFFTTKEEGKGTGLGLATIYGIARQNGGGAAVASAPGKGSTFTLYLPRCERPPVETQSPVGLAPSRGRGAILLVEDEEAVRRTTARMLQSLGYSVRAAGSGTEALALADAEGPLDLLATDVVMPGIKGPALAAMLAERRPGLRTLFMSGHAASALGEGGVVGEGVHFLQKPFTLDDLARAVRKAMDSAPAPSASEPGRG